MTSQLASHGVSVRAPKTAELIADQIRSKIVHGVLETGAALPPEAALTAQFGVSRPTLREAFRILEAESLLVVRRGARGGARVTAPEPAVATRHVGVLLQLRGTSAGDLHAARAAIEPPCAGEFAQRGSREAVDELRSIGTRVAEELSSPSWRWSTAVDDFRRHLLTHGSSPATALLGGLVVDLDRVQALADSTPARDDATATACLQLAELIAARESAAAVECWARYLAAVPPSDVLLDSLI